MSCNHAAPRHRVISVQFFDYDVPLISVPVAKGYALSDTIHCHIMQLGIFFHLQQTVAVEDEEQVVASFIRRVRSDQKHDSFG